MILVVLAATQVPSAQAAVTAEASDPVSGARRGREAAEAHLAELTRRRADLEARIAGRAGRAHEIVEAIAEARRVLRQTAVQAYISGDEARRLTTVLTTNDLLEAADRVNFVGRRAVNAADAAARFEQLRRDNDPADLALAAELDRLDASIADANDQVLQARANEADAEREAQLEADARRRAAVAAAVAAADAAARTATTTRAGARVTVPAPMPTTARAGTLAPTTTAPKPNAAPGSFTAPASYHPVPGVGPSPEAWAKVRACESGGDYTAVSGSGRYRGAYQFDQQTWESLGGVGDPATAPPAQQDLAAAVLYSLRGARAWPVCGRALA